MDMDQAAQHYKTLRSFKTEEVLVEYCKKTLGDVEKLHYDYKTKDDSIEAKLGDPDKRNLAKAISGFANSAGGVLIWGIEDKDVKPKPIKHAEQFLRNLLDLAPIATEPGVQGVDGHFIPADEDDNDAGFALLFVPESDVGPHRVILKDKVIQDHYYFRSGSSFLKASHSQLEDMFGRRPKPKLVLSLKRLTNQYEGNPPAVQAVFNLRNEGRALAKHPLIIVKMPSEARGYGGKFKNRRSDVFEENGIVGISTIEDEVIHPGVDLEIIGLTFHEGKFRSGETLELKCRVSAEGQQLTHFTLKATYPTDQELGR